MPYTYRVFTANCGNASIGPETSKLIAGQLIQYDQADFYVLNCQEVNFEDTLKELRAVVGQDYAITCSDKMPTYTKLEPKILLTGNTGMATFIIHKNSLKVEEKPSQLIRRSSYITDGTAFNKGAIVTGFTINSNDKNPPKNNITIETVSAHLDSNDPINRSYDWENTRSGIIKKVSTWEELVKVCPHLRLSGYDANTRNEIVNKDIINLAETIRPSMLALYQAPLGGESFSQPSTYKTDREKTDQTLDQKRNKPGRQPVCSGGSLDYVVISDGSIRNDDPIIIDHDDILHYGSEKGTNRDHDVIGSPLKHFDDTKSDFERVKGQLATYLIGAAPDLAQEIINLVDDKEGHNRETLLKIYQLFLSPNGLLKQALVLHRKKLFSFHEIMKLSNLNLDEAILNVISDKLFPTSPWFQSVELKDIDTLPVAGKLTTTDTHALLKPMSEELEILNNLKNCQDIKEFNKELIENNINVKLFNGDDRKTLNQYCKNFVDELDELNRLVKSIQPRTQKGSIGLQEFKDFIQHSHEFGKIIYDEAQDNPQFLEQATSIMKYCTQIVRILEQQITNQSLNNGQQTIISLSKELLAVQQQLDAQSNIEQTKTNGKLGQLIASFVYTALSFFTTITTGANFNFLLDKITTKNLKHDDDKTSVATNNQLNLEEEDKVEKPDSMHCAIKSFIHYKSNFPNQIMGNDEELISSALVLSKK